MSYLIADSLLNAIGDPDLQRIRRHIMDVLDQLSFSNSQMEVIRSGGCAEGFRMKGTDVDQMYVDKLTKVVAETPKNLCTSLAVVKLMQLSKVPPGYVNLVVLTPHTSVPHIRKSMQRVAGEYFLSSEAFVRWYKDLSPDGILHGPCVMDRSETETNHDRAFCLEYTEWPVYANEWLERKRSFDWPLRQLIRKMRGAI